MRGSRLHLALLCGLLAAGCGPKAEVARSASPDSLPVALTVRAQRDSARAALLLTAYLDRVAAHQPDSALALFFPESLRIATESGGIEVEGRSDAMARQVAADSGAARVRRIVLLRKAGTDLLEQNYRETWWLRYVPDRPDSAVIERRFHLLQQLGNDTRWMGSPDAKE